MLGAISKISRFQSLHHETLLLVHLEYTLIHYLSNAIDINKMVTMMNFEPSAAAQESYILCADCGTVINSTNGANLCESIKSWIGQPRGRRGI